MLLRSLGDSLKTGLGLAGLALVFLLASCAVNVQASDGGKLYLVGPQSTVKQGDVVTVSVRLAPSSPVDAVAATVTFDRDKLDYQGVSYGGSPFTTHLAEQTTADSVMLTSVRFSGDASKDDVLVANISFIAQADSGSTRLGLKGSAAGHGTTINPSLQPTTIHFTSADQPAVQCPPGETGRPPHCTLISLPIAPTTKAVPESASPQPQANVRPTIKSTKVEFDRASLTVITKTPARLFIRYGTERNQLSSLTSLTAAGTKHTIKLDQTALSPGQTYYYQAVTADEQGRTTLGDIRSFTTKGLTIRVRVFDKNHQPLRHKNVTIHSKPVDGQTNDQGYVTFNNLAPGRHILNYSDGHQVYSQPIIVINNVQTEEGRQSAKPQSFAVVYDMSQGGLWQSLAAIITATLAGLTAVALIAYQYLRRRSGGGPLSPEAVSISSHADASPTESLDDQLSNVPDPPRIVPGTVIRSSNNTGEN